MAAEKFVKAKEKFLTGAINLLTDDIKVVCVDHGVDTPNIETDEFLSDIAEGARIATTGNLANKSITGGVFDADPITMSAVVGDPFESIVMYKDTGDPATSPLIAYDDAAEGLPCTPDGTDITITWSNGDNKIFAL